MKQAAITPDEFRQWMNACNLSKYQEAADALGISLDTAKSYGSGRSPINGTVALAMRAVFHKMGPWTP
tara:strand:+ start:692 stop:895 length:204 start_codon:yes stop_codon:yes gene_type:complete